MTTQRITRVSVVFEYNQGTTEARSLDTEDVNALNAITDMLQARHAPTFRVRSYGDFAKLAIGTAIMAVWKEMEQAKTAKA
jgi:hypothetical protein